MGLRTAALLLALLSAPPAASARDLREFYRERCAVCHGADGSGRGPGGVRLGARTLADGRWLARQEDGALAATLRKGTGAMPGFARQLDDAEARRLVAEVLRPLAGRRRP